MLVATRKRAEAGVRLFKRFGSADSIVHFFQTLGVRGEFTLPIVQGTEIAQTRISMAAPVPKYPIHRSVTLLLLANARSRSWSRHSM